MFINSLRNWFKYSADDLFMISLRRTMIGKNFQNDNKNFLIEKI